MIVGPGVADIPGEVDNGAREGTVEGLLRVAAVTARRWRSRTYHLFTCWVRKGARPAECVDQRRWM